MKYTKEEATSQCFKLDYHATVYDLKLESSQQQPKGKKAGQFESYLEIQEESNGTMEWWLWWKQRDVDKKEDNMRVVWEDDEIEMKYEKEIHVNVWCSEVLFATKSRQP